MTAPAVGSTKAPTRRTPHRTRTLPIATFLRVSIALNALWWSAASGIGAGDLRLGDFVPPETGPYNASTPNLLFIFTDQQRYDALRFVQDELQGYNNKFKLRTPNLDRLYQGGVYFRNAYCQSPQCTPARSTIRTGCTVERTGLQDGALKKSYPDHKQFKEKVEAMITYDNVLVTKRGYVAENYGRFDLPDFLYYDRPTRRGTRKTRKLVIQHNNYDFNLSNPRLDAKGRFQNMYRDHIVHRTKRDDHEKRYSLMQQTSGLSWHPYDPLPLDGRFGIRDALPNGAGQNDVSSSQYGRDTLPSNYSSTAVTGGMALEAIKRLSTGKKPFSLTISFWNPHPPNIAAPEYFDYYYPRRGKLYVSPSYNDPMEHSAYVDANKRLYLIKERNYDHHRRIQEWTAAYYAMCEEVDEWIGRILSVLQETGLAENTLVVFTSDHGEMLGAHAMRNKGVLLEEAIRVPLILRFTGKMERRLAIEQPVSHLDLFATILDYLGASQYDNSDGRSLRRWIEHRSYNRWYDETAVVTELDLRYLLNKKRLSSRLGVRPEFMIRHGRYKLIVPKKADSEVIDMLYDLEADPGETKNLLAQDPLPWWLIGKAERKNVITCCVGPSRERSSATLKLRCRSIARTTPTDLKILLLEWMNRNNNGKKRYYSDKKYNFGEGRGDVTEVRERRTWPEVKYWQSDSRLCFGEPVLVNDRYTRNEYLYIGSTKEGILNIRNIIIKGRSKLFFTVDKRTAIIARRGGYVRVKVTYSNPKPVAVRGLEAYLEIYNDANTVSTVHICGKTWVVPTATQDKVDSNETTNAEGDEPVSE